MEQLAFSNQDAEWANDFQFKKHGKYFVFFSILVD